MDTYLALAERVLATEKRALSALQILRIAYRDELAPPHLGGQTQHKTLQARLSEDILRYREGSKFYRTAPGKFFLSALRNHPDVPESDRTPIVARRRQRDLPQNRALAFEAGLVSQAVKSNRTVAKDTFANLIKGGSYHYARSTKRRPLNEIIVWSFMIVVKEGHVLSYRTGPYREQRDSFMSKRAIGFYSPVIDTDLTLFDQADHGLVWSGMKALASDLDLYDDNAWRALHQNCHLEMLVYPEGTGDLLALVSFACPDWLEPTSSRLAINDLEWLDVRSPINHHEDFDPWSQALLPEARRIALQH